MNNKSWHFEGWIAIGFGISWAYKAKQLLLSPTLHFRRLHPTIRVSRNSFWKMYLLSKDDIVVDERPGEDHALLKVDVVVGRAVNEEEVSADEMLGRACEVRGLIALPVAVLGGHAHVTLRVGRVCGGQENY